MGDSAKSSARECRAITTEFLVTLKQFLSSHSRRWGQQGWRGEAEAACCCSS